jgi:lipid-binding SYLF domain-containing protein
MKEVKVLAIMLLVAVALLTVSLAAVSPDQSIQAVQAVLKDKGFDREFQRSNNLEPTGMLDENTRKALGVKTEIRADRPTDKVDQPSPGSVEDELERARKAGTILSEIMGAPDQGIPGDLLEESHAIAIVPHVVKGAFIFGGRYGKGLIARRHEDGTWSAPAFITIGGGSVGFQIGGSATDLVLVFTNEDGLKPLLKGKFTLGGDVSVAAGPVGRTASGSTDITLNSAIYSYSRSKGLFAGVSLDGASITMDDSANEAVYGSQLTGGDILLRGKTQTNHAGRFFIESLQKHVPPHHH